MKRWLLTVAFLAALLILVPIVSALQGAPPASAQAPAIIAFGADLPAIAFADAEDGDMPAVLSWYVVNVDSSHQLRLEAYRLNTWIPLLAPDEQPLAPIGNRQITIEHPLNFGPPTYRLSILDSGGAVLDERIVTIPYAAGQAQADPPAITAFTSPAQTITPGEVVPIHWEIENRTPGTHILFEQVLADNSAVSVDLPRPYPWVASSGDGVVAPIVNEGDTSITLRLSLIDVVSGAVLDAETLSVPDIGAEAGPEVTAVPGGAQIYYFEPSWIGDEFSLVWEVKDAASVKVEWVDRSGNPVAQTGLPPLGSLEVDLTQVGLVNGDRYQFTLTATDAQNQALPTGFGDIVTTTIEFPAQLDITVNALTASATELSPGGRVTLFWEVTGATRVTLARLSSVGVVSEIVGEDLPLVGTADYTLPLVATTEDFGELLTFILYAEGETSAYRAGAIRVPIAPQTFTVDSVTASPTSATVGDTVTINWSAPGAQSVTVGRLANESETVAEVIGQDLPPTGSINYTFAQASPDYGSLVTFVVDARGATGEVRRATVSVSFSSSGLSIVSFTASPDTVAPGGPVTLTWQVNGATNIILQQIDYATGVLTTLAENLPPAGSVQVNVPTTVPGDLPFAHTYNLVAENDTGESLNRSALVTIANA